MRTGQIISCVDLQVPDQYSSLNSSQGTSHGLPVASGNDETSSNQGFLSDKSVPSSTGPEKISSGFMSAGFTIHLPSGSSDVTESGSLLSPASLNIIQAQSTTSVASGCCLPTSSCNQVQAGSFSNIKSGSFHNLPTKPCQSLQPGYRLHSGSYSQLQSGSYNRTDVFHELETVNYTPLQSGSCNDIQSGSGISSLSKPISTSSLSSSPNSSFLSVHQSGDLTNLTYSEPSRPATSDTLSNNDPHGGSVAKCRSLEPSSHGENAECSRENGTLLSGLQGRDGMDATALQPLLPPTLTRNPISLFQIDDLGLV